MLILRGDACFTVSMPSNHFQTLQQVDYIDYIKDKLGKENHIQSITLVVHENGIY
jgi:hypothetical protein